MKNRSTEVLFRKATAEDIELIYSFILDLAEYENLVDEVITDIPTLSDSLFGERSYAEVIFAMVENQEVGFVLFFHNFSTFTGRPGIYIEDLFVKKDYRGMGVGKAILSYISALALERKCSRVEWWVLKWNPARDFYKGIGAKSMDDWIVYRLSNNELTDLASKKG